jgi:carboxyl-terminal processing protease
VNAGIRDRLTNTRHTFVRGAALGIILGLGFMAGFLFRDSTIPEPTFAQDNGTPEIVTFDLLREAHVLVAENYYAELPTTTELEYAAIRGYLGALNDPFSFFNDPPVSQSTSDALAGRYGGIGVDVKRNEAGLIALYPYPNSPAERLGVANGDILIAVNGDTEAPNGTIDVIRQLLRGEITDEESGVEITIRSGDSDDERTLFIPFEEIQVPSVIWRVLADDSSIGYIHITSFTARTPDELTDAVADLREQGVTGLILDLRDNFGGLLRESIDVADEFLDGGVIVIEQSRAGESSSDDPIGGVATDLPMTVITNGNTASAAEVVAGALQDNGRAILIGQRTRGKGSVQFIFGLSDGSSIRITGAIWLTPNRQPLDGVGLTPDIEMIPDENNRDVELGEAVRQLHQLMVSN